MLARQGKARQGKAATALRSKLGTAVALRPQLRQTIRTAQTACASICFCALTFKKMNSSRSLCAVLALVPSSSIAAICSKPHSRPKWPLGASVS